MGYYKHLTKKKDVCGGRVIVKGTRIEPRHVVGYGTFDEIEKDFNLSKDQIAECYHYEISRILTPEDVKAMEDDWEAVGNIINKILNLR